MRYRPTLRQYAVLAFALILGLSPVRGGAQERAGVVTGLEGNVTSVRLGASQPETVKLKDSVYFGERITTGERAIARLLLGGKAVVTLRERSRVTITEEPGRSTVDVISGKIALAVAHERMRPGERIEIRTPNAVAGVRGTALVAEVMYASADAADNPLSATSRFFGFSGTVDVCFGAQSSVCSNPLKLLAGHFISVTGFGSPSVGAMTGDMRAAARDGLLMKLRSHGDAATGVAKDNAIKTTVDTFSSGEAPAAASGGGPVVSLDPSGNPPPILPGGTSNFGCGSGIPVGSPGCPAPPPQVQLVQQPPPPPPPQIFPAIKGLTPDSINRSGGPFNSPAFGTLAPNGLVTDQYSGLGVAFGPARVGIFFDGFFNDQPVNAWGGVNAQNVVDLVSPVSGRFVATVSGTTKPATTDFVSVEVGFAAVGSIELDVFGEGGVLLGSTTNGDQQGPHGRTIASISMPGIRSFQVSGSDTWGLDQIETGSLVDPPAELHLSGPLARKIGEQLDTNAPIVDMAGESVVSDGSDALVWLTGTTMHTRRGYLALTDSTVSTGGSLLRLDGGSDVSQTGRPDPFVWISGGSLITGTNGIDGHLIDLAGRIDAVVSDPDPDPVTGAPTGLVLGSDQPMKPATGAPVLAITDGATVTARGSALRIDTALLEATAPLLALAGGSQLTTSANVIDLVKQAKVTVAGSAVAMVNLDASLLKVMNGNLVNVAGGSRLSVAGDLVRLAGGSSLSLNGLLLSLSGGSAVDITGALVRFSGTGNVLSVNNSFTPTAIIAGIPIYGPTSRISVGSNALLSGLGTAGTIKINGVSLTANTPLSALSGSLVAIDGTSSLRIGR